MAEYIERQAVVDKIEERQRKLIYCFGFENDIVKTMDIAKSIVIAIPSAQPKRGKWIYHIDDLFPAESTKECDQCHAEQPLICDDEFCPNCGAKMDAQGENEEGEDNG